MSRLQVVGFRIVTGEDVMLNGSDSELGVREPVRFVTVTTDADVRSQLGRSVTESMFEAPASGSDCPMEEASRVENAAANTCI